MLMRTNVPMRCFGNCSVSVNWTLFNAVVTSEIKLKQNNFTETQNIVCFVSVLFQFYFSYNHGLSVTVWVCHHVGIWRWMRVWSKHSNDMVKLLPCVCPSAFLWVYCVLLYILYCFFISFILILSICMSVCLLFMFTFICIHHNGSKKTYNNSTEKIERLN